MKKNVIYWFAVIGLTTILSACDRVPQVEMDAAKSALTDAQAAKAETYTPEAFAAAQDSLKSALNLVEASQSKWFPNYDQSREKLANAEELARKVKMESENRKAEIQLEVQSMAANIRKLITDNQNILSTLPKGKEGKAALEAMNTENSSIEPLVVELENLLKEGKVMDAKSKALLASSKAQSLNQELEAIQAKYQKAKK